MTKRWDFRASARNLKSNKVGGDASGTRKWEEETSTPILDMLGMRNVPKRHLYIASPAAAQRDALNPIGPQP